MRNSMKSLLSLWAIAVLSGMVSPVVSSCSRPVTVQSIQQDVPTNGTKLLRATIEIQNAIYGSVKAKAISPETGIKLLDVTQLIGERGLRTAADLDRLDAIVKAGQPVDGALVSGVLGGLAEMSNQYPQLLGPGIPAQIATAVTETQKLIVQLQDFVNKVRTP